MNNIESVVLKLYQVKCKTSVAHHFKLYKALPGLILKLRQQCLIICFIFRSCYGHSWTVC